MGRPKDIKTRLNLGVGGDKDLSLRLLLGRARDLVSRFMIGRGLDFSARIHLALLRTKDIASRLPLSAGQTRDWAARVYTGAAEP